jgi:hypothetical protein
MIYHGVIVDMLTRTTELIKVDSPEEKPDKEFVSAFCFCKWFPQTDYSEYGVLVPELLALKYERAILDIFEKLNVESPSPFASYAKKCEGSI